MVNPNTECVKKEGIKLMCGQLAFSNTVSACANSCRVSCPSRVFSQIILPCFESSSRPIPTASRNFRNLYRRVCLVPKKESSVTNSDLHPTKLDNAKNGKNLREPTTT